MPANLRYFHQTFAVPPRNPRYDAQGRMVWAHDLHRIRDASALIELGGSLQTAEYGFEETILGLYSEQTSSVPSDGSPLGFPPELRDGDLLVITTRPPLNDIPTDEEASPNPIRGSGSPQEMAVLETLRRAFLAYSSRTEIKLREAIQCAFQTDPVLGKRSLPFFRREGRLEYDRQTTVCFLLKAPEILDFRPRVGCLCVFGMAGTENLIWARALRKQKEILARAVSNSTEWMIVVGICTLSPHLERRIRPLTLSFADRFQDQWRFHQASAPGPSGPWHIL